MGASAQVTVFGPRPPELAAEARADLAACRASLRNGSKTFLAASFLLPRGVHEPASALYAFCRLADDAVDAEDRSAAGASDGLVDPAQLAGPVHAARRDDRDASRDNAVARLRQRLALAYAGTPQPHPADRALATVVARHGIPAALFDALLEGFEWDTQGRRYHSLDDLHAYAARVAGTVGAMMALLMGVRTPEGLARACDLGVAMQLSNIARDVGEDARLGRLYLPRDWMLEAGIDPDAWLAAPVFSPALAGVVRRVLDAAEALYARVGAGVACLPLACRPGINAARFMYAEIGHEVARRGFNSLASRARVSGARKAWLLMRSVVQLAPFGAKKALPPLGATRFLVDAATGRAEAVEPASRPTPRGVAGRVIWTFELFARLEQRDRQRTANHASRAEAA